MSDRGMKKWAPYKSLNEQWSTLDQIKKEEIKEKPKISNEKAEEINDILVNYEGQELTIRYFRKGQAFKCAKAKIMARYEGGGCHCQLCWPLCKSFTRPYIFFDIKRHDC